MHLEGDIFLKSLFSQHSRHLNELFESCVTKSPRKDVVLITDLTTRGVCVVCLLLNGVTVTSKGHLTL